MFGHSTIALKIVVLVRAARRQDTAAAVWAAALSSFVVLSLSQHQLGRPPVRPGQIVSASVPSPAVGHNVRVAIYLPPGFSRSGAAYPVLYLLHGLPGSGAQMLTNLQLLSQADALIDKHQIKPMIVVAPSDGPTASSDSEWINTAGPKGARWGTFVDRDLVQWVDRNYPACLSRSGRSIGGVSMGGYGAINDALDRLGEFGAVTLWSAYFIADAPQVAGVTGSTSWIADSPLLSLDKRLTTLHADPLRISFYDSRSDEFFSENVGFARLLDKDHLVHRFRVANGPHAFALWRANLSEELSWLSQGEHC